MSSQRQDVPFQVGREGWQERQERQERKMTNQAIADVLPVSMKKIDRVKRRFVEEGLDAALDKRKAERSHMRKADGDFEARLVALSCSQPPAGHGRWSLRLLADQMVERHYVDAISHETVRRVLKNELKPWKKQQWVARTKLKRLYPTLQT